MGDLIKTAESHTKLRLWGIAGVFGGDIERRFSRFGGWFTQGGLLGGAITDGQLVDYFGQSRITGNFEPENIIEFDKKYTDRKIPFHYTFNYQDGVWIGKYSAEDGGEGEAESFIFPVSFNDKLLV